MSACFYVSIFVFSPVCVLHLPGHHGEELGEVDRAVAVGVNLGDNSVIMLMGMVVMW